MKDHQREVLERIACALEEIVSLLYTKSPLRETWPEEVRKRAQDPRWDPNRMVRQYRDTDVRK